MMSRAIAVALAFVTATSPASGNVVPWHDVIKDGLIYQMPPEECLRGPLPNYRLTYVPVKDLTARWPTGDTRMPYRFGMTLFAQTPANPGPEAKVFVGADLPKAVRKDMLAHELAHLRGCQHPGGGL